MQPQVHFSVPGMQKIADLSPRGVQKLTLQLLHVSDGDRLNVYADGSVTSSSSAVL